MSLSHCTWREPVNALTHFLGFLGAVVGTWMLIAPELAWTPKTISLLLYGLSLAILFLASSTYHFFDLGVQGNQVLRRFDHAAIYGLIAGTCIPVFTHILDGTWRIIMLALLIGLGILGIVLKMLWFGMPRWLSAGFYVGMGWSSLVAAPVMFPLMTGEQIFWLVGGGGVFSLGALVYAFKWPNPWPEVFGFHEIWHMFVLGGAGMHYVLVYSLIHQVPPPF